MQLDFPNSPVSGTTYPAPNGVTYTYDTSVGTGVWVAAVSAPLSVTPGSISGTAAVGSTLTYTPGVASGGAGPYTYTQQWKANGVVIAGQTGLTYVVAAGNAGQSITVEITATDSASATATAVTAPVAIPTALTVTAGSISGTAQVGQTLTYTPGVASGGVGPYTYTYQWNANGVAITGATALTYVPVFANVGQTLTVAITATDSTSATANATTAPTAAVATSTIPTASFNPTPSTGPTASNTVAAGVWNGTADTITSGGCIEFTVSTGAPAPGATYGQGPTSIANGQTLTFRWVSSAGCTGAANGTVINGTLSAASGGTNNYSLTVDTAPSNFSFTDLTAQPLSSAATSASITLAGTNVDTYLTTTGGTLTAIQASINGGAFVTVPASGTTLAVPPGATIQIRGTTGSTVGTGYTAILALGTATTTWTATTVSSVPTIATPAISAPNGATGLNPAVNSPAGITLQTTSTYNPSGGAGTTQTSSEWEVYRWVGGGAATAPTSDPPGANYAAVTGSPFSNTTPPFTSQFIPQSAFAVSSTYYARLRYRTTIATATDSTWSAWADFTTAASFTIPAGTAMGGGYFAGQIVGSGSTSGPGGLDNAGTIYNLIVAPVSSGGLSGTNTSGIQYRTTNAANSNANAQNENFGGLCTSEVLAGSATGGAAAYPVFNTFINGSTGPNAGAFNLATGGAGGGTGIGGFNDWYLPAKNELAILYFFLKPDSTANNTSSGSNPRSVTPYTPNTNYGAGFPNVTSNALFAGGAQAFSTADFYWSSTEYSSNTTDAWRQYFANGGQSTGSKTIGYYARAVRRIAA